MKTTYSLVIVLLSAIVLFSQCKKEESKYQFSCSTNTDSTTLLLLVDDVEKGTLPYLPDGPDDCNDSRGLRFSLSEGDHHFVAKDPQGNTRVDLMVSVGEDFEVQENTGYFERFQVNKCVAFELNYF